MNSFPSLGDIMQSALDGNDPQEYVRRCQTEISADALATFLKTLPESVNTFQLLGAITRFVGEDMANETLRSLMGIQHENGEYVLQPLGSTARLNKFAAIKIVREVTNASIRAAKDFVEATASQKLSTAQVRRINDEVQVLGYRVVHG